MKSKTKYGWKALGFDSYEEYLESDMWRSKRELILSLRPICEVCKTKKATQVHHLHYNTTGNESSKDLLVVCSSCHEKIHNK